MVGCGRCPKQIPQKIRLLPRHHSMERRARWERRAWMCLGCRHFPYRACFQGLSWPPKKANKVWKESRLAVSCQRALGNQNWIVQYEYVLLLYFELLFVSGLPFSSRRRYNRFSKQTLFLSTCGGSSKQALLFFEDMSSTSVPRRSLWLRATRLLVLFAIPLDDRSIPEPFPEWPGTSSCHSMGLRLKGSRESSNTSAWIAEIDRCVQDGGGATIGWRIGPFYPGRLQSDPDGDTRDLRIDIHPSSFPGYDCPPGSSPVQDAPLGPFRMRAGLLQGRAYCAMTFGYR